MEENFKLYNLEMKVHLFCDIRAIRNYWILFNNIFDSPKAIRVIAVIALYPVCTM